ncbi:F-box/kelch-repeat protein [Raphanus sativus]|nr:F-box/kelch-repeat protein [Raphanus sativus]
MYDFVIQLNGPKNPEHGTDRVVDGRAVSSQMVDMSRRVLVTEHEGDVFVMLTSRNNSPTMFKLNVKRNAWEEKRELRGLTVFASHPTSLTRAGLSVEERNRIYPSHNGHLGLYYSLGDGMISSRLPSSNYLSNRIAWVDPPHNNYNL